MLCTSIGFIALLVVPALDFRFGWSAVPLGSVVVGDMLVVTGFYGIAHVYRENTFTSATIEVAADREGRCDRAVCHRPPSDVRGCVLYLLGTPLALGSCRARRARGHDAVSALAALGRRTFPGAVPARIHRIPEAGPASSGAMRVVG